MSVPHFHSLLVRRVVPDAAGSAAVTFAVPPELRGAFDFTPGQFLTLRSTIDGSEVRRSYSICSPKHRYSEAGELEVGIKPVEGGMFSRWATETLKEGHVLDVMPPDGRFTARHTGAKRRVAFAAGSGITPVLSIVASTLASEPDSHFTLVYGNQRTSTIMFHEALQDLKDRYPARLTLVHLLSRQPQEAPLFNGRLDEPKVAELLRTVVPAAGIDEAFICGPEGMIEATERALKAAGVPAERIHTERFASSSASSAPSLIAKNPALERYAADSSLEVALEVVLDGKSHRFGMGRDDHVLDVGLEGGLDLPYSCRGGVCCTCRAKVLEGKVHMDRNFTLEQWEVDKGFVLTCQARPLTEKVTVSFDER